jgi:outer membrane protein assembly factor BamD (BamD/ComL family)
MGLYVSGDTNYNHGGQSDGAGRMESLKRQHPCGPTFDKAQVTQEALYAVLVLLRVVW